MVDKTLAQLYAEHEGKVSIKWPHYLAEYHRIFIEYRNKSVNMLEIGVQNGGSLEIWSKYFLNGEKFIGCDTNPACSLLEYDDPRIKLVVGDANSDSAQTVILQHSPKFDIIIDDGSHLSSDIIKSFVRYFPKIKDGGIFIAEDLHCSYWQEFEGGLFDPFSSITFFKLLADAINHEHWGVKKKRTDLFKGFLNKYRFELDEALLEQVHSIEFINSTCVVRKSRIQNNLLGDLFVAGKTEEVVPGHDKFRAKPLEVLSQIQNPWSTRELSPYEELPLRLQELDNRTEQISSLTQTVRTRDEAIANLTQTLAEHDKELEDLTQSTAQSDEKLANLNQIVLERNRQLDEFYSSASWRITGPLRVVSHQLKRLRHIPVFIKAAITRGDGFRRTLKKAIQLYRQEGLSGIKRGFWLIAKSDNIRLPDTEFLKTISYRAGELLEPRVLIIAELSIPQCTKYRVTQKQQMFESLDIQSTVHSWTDANACIGELSSHSLAIFYRVPACPNVLTIIAEAKRLKIPTFWEVDDLIFNSDVLAGSNALAELDHDVFKELLEGANLYHDAMLSCDKGIASTAGLATEMKKAGVSEAFIIENALDEQTLVSANTISASRSESLDGLVRIVYGSGTNTHNTDFKEASEALLNILKSYSNVRLRIIGTLDLSNEFAQYEPQIERIPFCSFEQYLSHLAECDINIAPLENYIFNEAKSNIKALEASVLRIPSICSPRSAFRQTITHGENGFLCETQDEWGSALELLITDTKLRNKIGSSAYNLVMDIYTPANIANQQLLPFIEEHHNRPTNTLRILSVNVLYAPRSYGGATIVAEETNKILNNHEDFNVYVFTTLPLSNVSAYAVKRYEVDGICIFGMGLPDTNDPKDQFENPHVLDAFESVLLAVNPDLVHIHCVQGIGVSIAELCLSKGVKYIVTLHDAWWVCGRQFMINRENKFCNQQKINLRICDNCVDDAALNRYRQAKLSSSLKNADLLLSPSQFFANFYIENGFPEDKVLVNKNGISNPEIQRKFRRKGPLIFGYVGGNTEVKGVELVKQSFIDLCEENIKLIVVDNTINLGYPSYNKRFFKGVADIEIIPAYTQKTIDAFFSRIDVLLFPTKCKESFGLTIREALARNVWVITTNAGGGVDDINHGKNGFIVPFDDKGYVFKQSIQDTIQHYQQFKIGSEIRLQTNHITLFEDQAKELTEVYKRVIQEKEASAVPLAD